MWGAIATIASSIGSHFLNQHSAKRNLNMSISGSKDLANFTWQKQLPTQMQALRDAGVNPILAYSGLGGGGVPTVSAPFSPVNSPDFSDLDLNSAKTSLTRDQRVQLAHQRAMDVHSAKIQDANIALAYKRLEVEKTRADSLKALNDAKAADLNDQIRNREKYLDNLTRSYFGNSYFGRLYMSDLVKLLKFSNSADVKQKLGPGLIPVVPERYWETP